MPTSSKQPTAKPISLTAAIKRDRWREEHARVVIDAWKQGGLTAQVFAERHKIPFKRLHAWSSKLGKKEKSNTRQQPLHFVPVDVVASATDDMLGTDAMELLLPGGIKITVGTGFDATALKRLIETVVC